MRKKLLSTITVTVMVIFGAPAAAHSCVEVAAAAGTAVHHP